MKNIRTYELISLLTKAISEQNQQMVNMYAYELTTRLYVPDTGYTFDEILEGFGYRSLEADLNQITIEEYMRTRERGNE